MHTDTSMKWIGMVALVSLMVAGCGGESTPAPATPAPATAVPSSSGDKPTAQAPKETAELQAEPAKQAEAPASAGELRDISDLEGNLASLKSYRVRLTYTFEGQDDAGKESKADLEFFQEVIAASQDQHTRISGAGIGSGSGEPVEFYQVGDMGYIYSPGAEEGNRCLGFTSGQNQSNPAALFKPTDLVGGLSQARLTEKGVDANGIKSDRYTFDEKSLGFGAFTSAKGEAWVAQDGGYMVKYVGEATGKSGFLDKQGEGTIKWAYNLTDVNQLDKIELPADCASQKLADDIPVPPNATDKNQFGAMITFKTTDEPATVADFYKAEMPGKGWTEGESTTMGDVITLNYEKTGRKLGILITKGDDGGVSVVITDQKTE